VTCTTAPTLWGLGARFPADSETRWKARLAALPTDPTEAALTVLGFHPDDAAEPLPDGVELHTMTWSIKDDERVLEVIEDDELWECLGEAIPSGRAFAWPDEAIAGGTDLGGCREEAGEAARLVICGRSSRPRSIVTELDAAVRTSPSMELVELLQRAIGHVVKVILHADDSSGLIGGARCRRNPPFACREPAGMLTKDGLDRLREHLHSGPVTRPGRRQQDQPSRKFASSKTLGSERTKVPHVVGNDRTALRRRGFEDHPIALTGKVAAVGDCVDIMATVPKQLRDPR
jgi:hypothetical protein